MIKRCVNWAFVTGLIMGLGIGTISLLCYFHAREYKVPVTQEAAAPVKEAAPKHWVMTNVNSSDLLHVEDAFGDEAAITFDGAVKSAKGDLPRLCDSIAEYIEYYNHTPTSTDLFPDISLMLAARLIQDEYKIGKSCMPKDIYVTADKPFDTSRFIGMLAIVGTVKPNADKPALSAVGTEMDFTSGTQKGPSK